MKISKYFFVIIFINVVLISCKAQQSSLIEKIDESTTNQHVDDSIINKLRNDNDVIIAYAIENFAWAKTINYKILAQKNNEWKAYVYSVSMMKQNPSKIFNDVKVDNESCNALIDFISKSSTLNIKGDEGGNFCPNGKVNCNINDAASERLWIITKKSVFNPSYYAPEFYEKCCPDISRALFLSIKNKINATANFTQPSVNE